MTLLDAAARNNASWCAAVCASHGLAGRWTDELWACATRTPPLYPDAVTLAPTATVDGVLAGIDHATPGASVKDSYASLALGASGFTELFEAQWIEMQPRPDPDDTSWWQVDATTLDAWTAAWGDEHREVFTPALLERRDLALVAVGPTDAPTAGAALHASDGVVGVSNLFACDGDLAAAWRGCGARIARYHPRAPVIGYEAGDSLTAAIAGGVRSLGPLRVWLATG